MIAGSRRIASPGCYATAITLALAPLYAAGLAEPDDVVVVAASGTTGAGRGMKQHLMASEVMSSLSPYKVGGTHQHTPEIEQALSDVAGVARHDVVHAGSRSDAARHPGDLHCAADAGRFASDLRAAFDAAYMSEPFVYLLPEGEWPQTGATLGSNSVHLQVAFDEHAGRIVVVSALDNLTKGAAGQAIQNANIALGFDETTALPVRRSHTVSVTAAKGFRAAGVVAGIKPSGRSDVALVVNDGPQRDAAGVFTGNRIKAAPVLWSQQVVKGGKVAAVVLNAGNANACTGALGFQHAHRTAEEVAELLHDSAAEIAVCSTGLIGEYLPIDKLLTGVRAAYEALAADGGSDAAQAIMTTDTVAKETVVTSPAGWTVGGMAKGAAMLAPGLATMLVVLTTDAIADASTLDQALRAATAKTFDRLDSDGCMSTNDTVLLLASGASGVEVDGDELAAAVTRVCAELADKLIDDCEGASKVIEIEVVGAVNESEAVDVARAVSRSNLLKCAIHGQDPNWGRILVGGRHDVRDLRRRRCRCRDQRRVGLPGVDDRRRPRAG